MKNLRNVFAISLLAFLLGCQPAEVIEPVVDADDQIIIGHIDRLDSAALGEERDIWIYVPRGAEAPENIGSKYPVVYLLDGNGHFHSVTGMIKQLSTTNGNTISPQMIVVGIPNTDRFRDLTPTHVEGTSGGGDAFLDFIEHELVPYIEATYPVSSYRTFIGHSLGGLMAIDALVTRPHLFDNFVAIDPSLWWDEQAILRKAEAALIERDFSGKSLYLAVANTMREGMSVGDVVNNTEETTLHIRSILQFSASAAAEQRNGLNFDWKYYDDDNHGSVPLIAEYDAIRFLFPWYQVKGDRVSGTPSGVRERGACHCLPQSLVAPTAALPMPLYRPHCHSSPARVGPAAQLARLGVDDDAVDERHASVACEEAPDVVAHPFDAFAY